MSIHPPITHLSEEETLFRDAVRDFANSEVAPLVEQMEKSGKYDQSLIPKFAELGLMGIDVPEEFGGAEGSFFMTGAGGRRSVGRGRRRGHLGGRSEHAGQPASGGFRQRRRGSRDSCLSWLQARWVHMP